MKKIVVVGGGIVGSVAAYYLSKQYEVVLIDNDKGQASKNAVGIICPWLSLRRNKKWLQLVMNGANFYQTLKKEIPHLPYYNTGTICFKKNKTQIDKIKNNLTKNQINIHCIEYENTYEFLNKQHPALFTNNGGRVNGKKLIETLHCEILKQGGKIIQATAKFKNNRLIIDKKEIYYDEIIFSCGAQLPQTLLDYQVDIYPQKGQLVKLQSNLQTSHLPGIMLNGEIDILPQENGIIAIGATHENDQAYDLSIDSKQCFKMIDFASETYNALHQFPIVEYCVGTRAYTSDFLPFFGKLDEHIYVACGLGSSGLTSGPYIGYLLSKLISNTPIEFDITPYSPTKYIEKK